MKKYYFSIFILLFIIFFSSCLNPAGLLYPYTVYKIDYMGYKPGLSSTSSTTAIQRALNEAVQSYAATNPGSSDEILFDGAIYEAKNIKTSTGGEPNIVWEHFYEEIEKHNYVVGSCWAFVHWELPAKGSIGTGYELYVIVLGSNVRRSDGKAYFSGVYNISPKR